MVCQYELRRAFKQSFGIRLSEPAFNRDRFRDRRTRFSDAFYQFKSHARNGLSWAKLQEDGKTVKFVSVYLVRVF